MSDPAPESNESCGVCRFRVIWNTGPNHGQCRRHAPQVELRLTMSQIYDHNPAWPLVNNRDWCGDFERSAVPST